MSNLAKKVNNVLCGDLRRVNDLIKPVISKINDIEGFMNNQGKQSYILYYCRNNYL
jgi:hypothetical protein